MKCKGELGLLESLLIEQRRECCDSLDMQGNMWREWKRVVKKITRSNVRGIRPRGKSRIKWMDSVKRELHVREMSVEQGRVIVHGRNEWRSVMKSCDAAWMILMGDSMHVIRSAVTGSGVKMRIRSIMV